jgi:hypothetical protein
VIVWLSCLVDRPELRRMVGGEALFDIFVKLLEDLKTEKLVQDLAGDIYNRVIITFIHFAITR